MAQFLWPVRFVVPKCSPYTVATGFLGQTTQTSMYHIFWALNLWTSYRPSPGRYPSCTHLDVQTCLQVQKYVYTHDFANVFMGFQGSSPILG